MGEKSFLYIESPEIKDNIFTAAELTDVQDCAFLPALWLHNIATPLLGFAWLDKQGNSNYFKTYPYDDVIQLLYLLGFPVMVPASHSQIYDIDYFRYSSPFRFK